MAFQTVCVRQRDRSRGADFEHDLSSGDMIGVISGEKYDKERFEMEVAARLRGFVNVWGGLCYCLNKQS